MAKLRRSTTHGSWWNWERVTEVKIRECAVQWRRVQRFKNDPRLRKRDDKNPSEPG